MHYIHVDTILFRLLHSYMFQAWKGHPQGVLIHFMSRIYVYVSIYTYQIKDQSAVCYMTLVKLPTELVCFISARIWTR